jgi:hypothetical protein
VKTALMEVPAARVATAEIDAALVERVLLHGDLRQLTPGQKVAYYRAVCESVGLNPLTQPFQYLTLSGKEILYARRDATEQLRKLHAVSIQIMAREVMGDCYVVTARATLPNGRQDENIGAVPIANVNGEARANAMMKAETKAKRRVTLAICGLGMLDETEVDPIPSIQVAPDPPDTLVNVATGEAVPATDRPTPPEGFAYLTGVSLDGPWFHVYVPDASGTGSSMLVKTKLEKVGHAALQAYQAGIPVSYKVDKTGKWLQSVTLWQPDVPADAQPLDSTGIPF